MVTLGGSFAPMMSCARATQIGAKALVAIPGVEIRVAEIRDFVVRGLSKQTHVPNARFR
jgi:hypothetical protein